MILNVIERVCAIAILLLPLDLCYPVSKPSKSELKPDPKDEKHFPNGTILGQYTYLDNDGNPIQVKYFADDSSYGVELKSVRVFGGTNKEESLKSGSEFDPDIGLVFDTTTDVNKALEFNQDSTVKDCKHDKSTDYDIYVQEESPRAGKGKVKVYLADENKRKVRDLLIGLESMQHCRRM